MQMSNPQPPKEQVAFAVLKLLVALGTDTTDTNAVDNVVAQWEAAGGVGSVSNTLRETLSEARNVIYVIPAS